MNRGQKVLARGRLLTGMPSANIATVLLNIIFLLALYAHGIPRLEAFGPLLWPGLVISWPFPGFRFRREVILSYEELRRDQFGCIAITAAQDFEHSFQAMGLRRINCDFKRVLLLGH